MHVRKVVAGFRVTRRCVCNAGAGLDGATFPLSPCSLPVYHTESTPYVRTFMYVSAI